MEEEYRRELIEKIKAKQIQVQEKETIKEGLIAELEGQSQEK